MSKIRLGILGGGGNSLIGVLHRIASSMFDRYQIVGGVFNPNWDDNIEFATSIGLPTNRIYKDFNTLIEEELQLPEAQRMQVVSILTPISCTFRWQKNSWKMVFILFVKNH